VRRSSERLAREPADDQDVGFDDVLDGVARARTGRRSLPWRPTARPST